MRPELTALTLAALLQVVQFVLFALPANIELTPKYTVSPRDKPPGRAMSLTTARLQRALHNHFESLILFTIAVLVVTLGDQSSPLTQHRRLYLPRRPPALRARLCLWLDALALGDLGGGLFRHHHYAGGSSHLTSADSHTFAIRKSYQYHTRTLRSETKETTHGKF